MGGSHSHREHDDDHVEVGVRARIVLLGLLALCAAGTVAGLVHLWPDHERVESTLGSVAYAAPGVTFPHAEVVSVGATCPQTGPPPAGETLEEALAAAPEAECGQVTARVLEGADEGDEVGFAVPPDVEGSGLRAGDLVELQRNPSAEGAQTTYALFGVDRSRTMWLLLGGFLLAVVAVARLRGLMAMVGLAAGGYVMVQFMLPALLLGASGLGVAVVGSAAIMFIALYLAHGPSMRTSAALAGTLGGIAVTAVVGLIAIRSARLSGVTDESALILSSYVDGVSFQGLLTCALIVAGLGVLNDVTITQSSAVWELRAAAPTMSRRALFRSGMRIGRDHIASTIYTIVFAYAGTALSVLLLLFLYQRPAGSLLSTGEISTEVVTTLATAIGLVLSVPLTTAIAAATVGPARSPA
ncbi:MAG: YibE/F family protein [Nocardioides sp.]